MANRRSNTGNMLLLAGAGIAAVLYLPGLIGAAVVGSNLTVRFRGVTWGGVTGSFPMPRLRLNLEMNLVNPTAASAKIDFLSLQMRTPDGVPFADITRVNADYRIGPKSETTIVVPFEISLTNTIIATVFPVLIATIKNAAARTPEKIGADILAALPDSLSMTGNIRVNSFRVPVSQTLVVFKKTQPKPR